MLCLQNYISRHKKIATPYRHHQTNSTVQRDLPSGALKDVVDLSNDDSDADIYSDAQDDAIGTGTVDNASKNSVVMVPADVDRRLADAREELEAIKEVVRQYEADAEEENTCEMCVDVIWQPCVLPCGHALCVECIQEYAYYHKKAGHQLDTAQCPFCRKPIWRAPVLSSEWQDRVDEMALSKGIPIPERTEIKWPPVGVPKRLRIA